MAERGRSPRHHPDRRPADGQRGRAAHHRQLALRVVGRLDAAEAARPEYGFLPAAQRPPGHDRQARHHVREPARDPGAAGGRVPVPGVGHPAVRDRVAPGPRRRRPPTTSSTGSEVRVKLLHTADWHLGKALRGRSRADEHAPCWPRSSPSPPTRRSTSCVVAGDVFESAAPAPEAQRSPSRRCWRCAATGADVVVDRRQPRQRRRLRGGAPGVRRRRHHRARPAVPARRRRRAWRSTPPAPASRCGWRCCRSCRSAASCAPPTCLSGRRVRRPTTATPSAWPASWRRLTAGFHGRHRQRASSPTAPSPAAPLGGGEREAQTHLRLPLPATSSPAPAHYVALGHLHRTQEVAGPAARPGTPGSPIASTSARRPIAVGARGRRRAGHARPRVRRVALRVGPRRSAPCAARVAELAGRRCASDVGDALPAGRRRPSRPAPASPTRCGRCSPTPSTSRWRRRRPAAERGPGVAPAGPLARTSCSTSTSPSATSTTRPSRRCSPSCSTASRASGEWLMRPVRLELGASAPSATRPWSTSTDTDVFALVGPDRRRASRRVIDAICFALYGSVPAPRREGRRRGHRPGPNEAGSGSTSPSASAGYTRGRGSCAARADGATTKEARLERRRRRRHGRGAGRRRPSELAAAVERAARPGLRPLHALRRAAPGRVRPLPARQAGRPPGPARAAARPRPLRRAWARPPAPAAAAARGRGRGPRPQLAELADASEETLERGRAPGRRLDRLRRAHRRGRVRRAGRAGDGHRRRRRPSAERGRAPAATLDRLAVPDDVARLAAKADGRAARSSTGPQGPTRPAAAVLEQAEAAAGDLPDRVRRCESADPAGRAGRAGRAPADRRDRWRPSGRGAAATAAVARRGRRRLRRGPGRRCVTRQGPGPRGHDRPATWSPASPARCASRSCTTVPRRTATPRTLTRGRGGLMAADQGDADRSRRRAATPSGSWTRPTALLTRVAPDRGRCSTSSWPTTPTRPPSTPPLVDRRPTGGRPAHRPRDARSSAAGDRRRPSAAPSRLADDETGAPGRSTTPATPGRRSAARPPRGRPWRPLARRWPPGPTRTGPAVEVRRPRPGRGSTAEARAHGRSRRASARRAPDAGRRRSGDRPAGTPPREAEEPGPAPPPRRWRKDRSAGRLDARGRAPAACVERRRGRRNWAATSRADRLREVAAGRGARSAWSTAPPRSCWRAVGGRPTR